MKHLIKNKVLCLFMAFVFVLALVLSSNVFTPIGVSAAEYPAWPSTQGYLLALEQGLEKWSGANIDWYLANPETEQFYISTPAELFGMAYLVNTEIEDPPLSGWVYNVAFEEKTITLTNDIDLSTINTDYTKSVTTYGELWQPIGWGPTSEPSTGPGSPSYAPFKGIFDGNGYTISGLANTSLFGVIINATITNLSTAGTVNSGTTPNESHEISGVVNVAVDSTLSNLNSYVNLIYSKGSASPVGGIVSYAMGGTTIDDCVFNGAMTSISRVNPLGGIVGQIGFMNFDTTVTVTDCVNYADLSGYYCVGGIVGDAVYSTTKIPSANIVLQNCVNYGNIVATLDYTGAIYSAGGILGSSVAYNIDTLMSVAIDGCANYGTVTGNVNTGGIVGSVQQGNLLSITNSYNRGDVTSTRTDGGIVGRVDNADGAYIGNTYNTGLVSAGTNSGGFIGLISGGTVDNVNNYYLDTSATGAVNSADYTGVTAKTSAEMKDPAFAVQLGNAYTTVTNNYPILTWQTNSNTDPTTNPDGTIITLNGDTTIVTGSDATYTVSVGNVNKLATVTLWFEVDGTYLTGKTFSGLNGFNLIGDIDWTQNGNIWTGRATLINTGTGGISTDNALDVFEMVCSSNANQLGTATVKIVRADLSGYNDNLDQAIPIDSTIVNGFVQTLIEQYFSKYDTNKDGRIDQLDLTTAQLYYMVAEGDANWNNAKASDINGDGKVDIEDLILILGNIDWSSPIL